jgi:hypothetical protein
MARKKRRRTSALSKHWGCVQRLNPLDLPGLLRQAEARLDAATKRARHAEFVADTMGGIDAGAVREQRSAAFSLEAMRREVASLKREIDEARASGKLPTPRVLTPEQEAQFRDLARRLLRK